MQPGTTPVMVKTAILVQKEQYGFWIQAFQEDADGRESTAFVTE
jgi:hypothetical protein